MISVRETHKAFGRVRAVRGISFGVDAGQVVGLLGPNGAGKTTLIRMITGYIPPDAGSVSVCGHDTINESILARRRLGYLPESAAFYPEMRVGDYLDYRGRLYAMRRKDRRAALAQVMQRCRIDDVAHRRIGHLSKGYRQRVGLASALLHDPPVLVLDEPTTGLDPAQIGETRTLIGELAERRTVLLSSHILPEVERTCSRVVVIAHGTVRADGTPSDLLGRHQGDAPYTVELRSGAAGGAARAIGILRAIDGVKQVRDRTPPGDDAWARLEVVPGPGAPDLRERIAEAASAAGVLVRELHRAAPTLEALFMRLIDPDRSGVDAGSRPGDAEG